MERECIYVMRHNELEQVWQYKFSTNGFNHFLYCRGTESEVREYIESEFPLSNSVHHALNEKEIEMLGRLNITIYIAPRK